MNKRFIAHAHTLFRKSIYLFILILLCFSCKEDDPPGTEPPQNNNGLSLATVEINTRGNTIVDEPKVLATIKTTTFDANNNPSTDYEGFVGIELRGSTSQALFDKKSYGLETRTENGEDLDASIFGFPEEEDWILNGPFSDKTLIRNALIYSLSNEIDRYASRVQFCELTINEDYKGVYVFMEKMKRDNNRIDINQLRPEENDGEAVTGGYILKLDKTTGNENGGNGGNYTERNSFASNYDPSGQFGGDKKVFFLYEYPKHEEITDPQKAYIQAYIRDFEDALASDDYKDENTGYRKYIDVESFIDYLILNEIAHNPDAYRLSTFIYKDKNDKLKMGPIWDFNIAFGNTNFCQGQRTDNWVFNYNSYCPGDFWLVPFWWERLLSDPYFTQKLKDRYRQLRAGALSDANILLKLNSMVDGLKTTGAINRNYDRWPVIGEFIWPNDFIGNSYDEEVDFLKRWIEDRTEWIDDNIDDL